MQKCLVSLLAICFAFSSKAQTYFPMLDSVANNWYLLANYLPVEPASLVPPPCSYGFSTNYTSYSIFTSGDTVINAVQYKILENSDYNNFNNCRYGYMREDTSTKKIYFMDNIFSPEELLYDFSMQIGDSISLNFYQPGFNELYQNGYYTLDSVGSTQVSAGVRPVYYLNCKTCAFSHTLEWVEGIGNLSHIVYTHSTNMLSWGFFTGNCTGFQYNAFDIVLCYEHNQRVYFDSCARNFAYNNFCFAYYDSCNYWNICGGLEEVSTVQSLAVSPNPASNETTISIQSSASNTINFILRDSNGKKIKSFFKNISAGNTILKINTHTLYSGIYFIQCITKNETLYRKVVIKRE